MDHDVIEVLEVVDMPVGVHWFEFTEVIFNQVALYLKQNVINQKGLSKLT